jgi:hypothetical protein
MEEENLKVYNLLKDVPKSAQKPIKGGRLKGMTDIKPMWRIEKLTEIFGMCGFGWKTVIKNKEVIEGANNEKIAVVDIDLYVKVDGVWSEPIEGTGGSSFIAKETNGLYTSDECFKMAYTDAISVACKSLGMGASIYWGDSKYGTDKSESAANETEPAKTTKATPGQVKALLQVYTGDKLTKLLEKNNISKIEDLPMKKASEIIGKLKEKKEGK